MHRLLLPFLLISCGGEDDGGRDPNDAFAACEEYVDASTACIEEAYSEVTGTAVESVEASLNGYCEAYDGLAPDQAREAADLLYCYADAINSADCSTADGYATAATEMLSDCL